MRQCNSVLYLKLPIEMEDGRVEVVEAYRAEHTHHRSPFPGTFAVTRIIAPRG